MLTITKITGAELANPAIPQWRVIRPGAERYAFHAYPEEQRAIVFPVCRPLEWGAVGGGRAGRPGDEPRGGLL